MYTFLDIFCAKYHYSFRPSYRGFLGLVGDKLNNVKSELKRFAASYASTDRELYSLNCAIDSGKIETLFSREQVLYFPESDV